MGANTPFSGLMRRISASSLSPSCLGTTHFDSKLVDVDIGARVA